MIAATNLQFKLPFFTVGQLLLELSNLRLHGNLLCYQRIVGLQAVDNSVS